MKLLIKGGRVVDPSQGLDAVMDVLIENEQIAALGEHLTADDVTEVIEADGLVVAPGLVDLHVHLREPGQEAKEDIITGTKAAVAGGFTTIVPMANTNPAIDSAIIVSGLQERIRREALADVMIVGAVTKGLKGEELAEMGDMAQNGVVAFSDDGHFVDNSRLFRSALEYASMFGIPVISHAEEPSLAGDGFMHEGAVSARLGIPGIPDVAEDIAVARDVLLAENTGAHLHVAHVSTKGAVEIIRQAKKRGVKVTAEATVHHLTLTDEAVSGFDTATKVAPPLRSIDHVQALRAGLKDGTIDAIITDHAPHAFEEKDVEFRYAPNGFCGLETSLGVILTELYHTGEFSLSEIIGKMSVEPAHIFSLYAGSLKIGMPGNLVLIDLDKEWVVKKENFYTRGKATPYEGKRCRGQAVMTIVRGNVRMKDGDVCVGERN